MIYGPRDIRLEEVPDPTVQHPGDAVRTRRRELRVWLGPVALPGVVDTEEPHRIGHELVGHRRGGRR
jgi:hypothetical protein